MQKEKLVMVSSKVLNQMAAYRKKRKPFTSYSEVKVILESEINVFQIKLKQTNISTAPRILIRNLETLLTEIAAISLLAVSEAGKTQRLWDGVFDDFFNTLGGLDYNSETYNNYGTEHIFNECIVTAFNQFSSDADNNNVNPDLLTLIAVHCLILINFIEHLASPVVQEEVA